MGQRASETHISGPVKQEKSGSGRRSAQTGAERSRRQQRWDGGSGV